MLDMFRTQAKPKELQSLAREVWRPVPGYEGFCEVSNLGRVRSVTRMLSYVSGGRQLSRAVNGRVLAQTVDKGPAAYGRLQVKLVGAGGAKTHLVHRIVALAFIGPCPDGMQVAHNDGNPANNEAGNLRYATPLENTRDKFAHGTVLRGSDVGNAKLNGAQVAKIRRDRANGDKVREVAARYGISQAQVSRICNGTRWAEASNA